MLRQPHHIRRVHVYLLLLLLLLLLKVVGCRERVLRVLRRQLEAVLCCRAGGSGAVHPNGRQLLWRADGGGGCCRWPLVGHCFHAPHAWLLYHATICRCPTRLRLLLLLLLLLRRRRQRHCRRRSRRVRGPVGVEARGLALLPPAHVRVENVYELLPLAELQALHDDVVRSLVLGHNFHVR